MALKRPLPDDAASVAVFPDLKKPRIDIPSHALMCNANALKLYKDLDWMEWRVPYIQCVAVSSERDSPTLKKLTITMKHKDFVKPNLNAILKECRGFSVPTEFLPSDATTYVDMKPLVTSYEAKSPVDQKTLDALDKYCEIVDLQLRELNLEIGCFRTLVAEAEAVLGLPLHRKFGGTWTWKTWEKDVDKGTFKFFFVDTTESQRYAKEFLGVLKTQPVFKGNPEPPEKPTEVYSRY